MRSDLAYTFRGKRRLREGRYDRGRSDLVPCLAKDRLEVLELREILDELWIGIGQGACRSEAAPGSQPKLLLQ